MQTSFIKLAAVTSLLPSHQIMGRNGPFHIALSEDTPQYTQWLSSNPWKAHVNSIETTPEPCDWFDPDFDSRP